MDDPPLPVELTPAAQDDLDRMSLLRIAHGRPAAGWHAGLIASAEAIGGMPHSYAPPPEQPDDADPKLRERLHRDGRAVTRILFRVDEDAVRVVHVRAATARSLTELEVRRLARR